MTAPTKDAAFGFLRGRLNEGSIELFEHAQLVRELRAVRTRYAAGRSSVVLPRISGSHCDLAVSLALACFEHDRRFGSSQDKADVHWDAVTPMSSGGVGVGNVPGYGDRF